MNVAVYVGVGIIGALLSVVLKQHRPEYSMCISLIAGMFILKAALTAISPVISAVTEGIDNTSGMESYGDILTKALAICYITRLAAESCEDAGERAIAGKIEFAGKCALTLIALPLFTRLMDMIRGLLQ